MLDILSSLKELYNGEDQGKWTVFSRILRRWGRCPRVKVPKDAGSRSSMKHDNCRRSRDCIEAIVFVRVLQSFGTFLFKQKHMKAKERIVGAYGTSILRTSVYV